MGVLKGSSLALALALAACAPKPLRFVDGSDAMTDTRAETGAHVDATVDGDEGSEASAPQDVLAEATADVADGIADVANDSASDDARDGGLMDVSVGDGGAIVPRSCAAAPTRADCRVIEVNPSTTFCLGLDETAGNATWNASPPLCGLSLSPFYVDANEVSVGRFRVFEALWAARALPNWLDARFARGVTFRAPLPPRAVTSEWNPSITDCTFGATPSAERDRHPINCVGWALAMYYCAWEGGHLLTSTQYEFLARWNGAASAAGRTYPWGEDAPDCARVHYGPCAGEDALRTRRVGSLGSPQSVFDLAGNVADLVADDFTPYATLGVSSCWTRSARDPLCLPTLMGMHIARGSSYANGSELVSRTVFRPSGASSDASPVRGFRCAYLR
jgi:formylglycine-generating enzyme required for sulfatase activity